MGGSSLYQLIASQLSLSSLFLYFIRSTSSESWLCGVTPSSFAMAMGPKTPPGCGPIWSNTHRQWHGYLTDSDWTIVTTRPSLLQKVFSMLHERLIPTCTWLLSCSQPLRRGTTTMSTDWVSTRLSEVIAVLICFYMLAIACKDSCVCSVLAFSLQSVS